MADVRECGRIDDHGRHSWQRDTFRYGKPVRQYYVCMGVTVVVVSNAPGEPREVAYTARCSFCGAPVPLTRVEVAGGPFWGLQAMGAGAGSDHLATWCHVCGPRHRKDEWHLQS